MEQKIKGYGITGFVPVNKLFKYILEVYFEYIPGRLKVYFNFVRDAAF